MKDILTDRVNNNSKTSMQQISIPASSHTIHLSKYTSATNPERQISLGYKLKKYIQTHFSPPATTQKRVITLMEKAVFLMFSRLRNKNLKEKPLVPLQERVFEPTSLDFKWLHPLEFRKGMASSILRVENSFSKERCYLIDSEEYQHFRSDWDTSINSESKDFKPLVLLYNQKEDQIHKVRPSEKADDDFQESSQTSYDQDVVHIPKYKKTDFVACTIQSDMVESQFLTNPKTTPEQRRHFGLDRDQQMKFFFITRLPMSEALSKYLQTLTISLNDMIKFVGYEEPVRFEGNYQTNDARWCVRNQHTIAFNSLKTKTKNVYEQSYLIDENQANKFLYTTDASYENMLVLISYGEQSRMSVVYGDQVDQQARMMMFEVIDVSDPVRIQQSMKKLKKMDDISVFDNIKLFARRTGDHFTIETQELCEFMERCQDEESDERKCLINHMDFVSKRDSTISRKVDIAGTGVLIQETCNRSNFRQLLIAAEMWRRTEKAKRQEKKKNARKWNLGDFKLPK